MGFVTVGTTAQVRAAIADAPPFGSLALYLPPNSELQLGGEPIKVGTIELQLSSDDAGATLDAQYASRIFEVTDGARLWLYSMTLANGCAAGNSTAGGAMLITNSSVSMAGSAIVNASAQTTGGALHISEGGRLVMDSSTISNATALKNGGALHVSHSSVKVSNTIIDDVATYQAHGGAIFATGSSTIRLERGNITRSIAALFGGVVYVADGPSLMMTGCVISHCSADQGGLLTLFDGAGDAVMQGCDIVASSSVSYGGLLLVLSGALTVTECAIKGVTSLSGAIVVAGF
eukprot:920191-Prymnesium_polylepis.1